MRWIGKNTLFRGASVVFASVAMILSLSLAGAEVLALSAAAQVDRLPGEVYYFFPDQVGEPAASALTGDSRFSHLRMDFQRSFALPGVNGPAYSVCALQSRTNSKNGPVNLNGTIPLRLRI